jgi:hypothetical protein
MMGGGNVCADTVDDPQHCGMCATVCAADQACLSSACSCRPGLSQCGASGCVDELHDPNHCGTCGNACGLGERCVDGQCQQSFCGQLGRTNCGGGCFTLQQLAKSPLHCSNQPGNCGATCAENEVCAEGTCAAFFTSTACTTCPCPACGSGTTCCTYPGTTEAICVQGDVCPQ